MELAMSSPTTRKRPAPGTVPSPTVPIQQLQRPYPSQEQIMQWNSSVAGGNNYVDASGVNMNPYAVGPQVQQGQAFAAPSPSNALVSIQNNRALVPTGPRASYDANTNQWSSFGDDKALVPGGGASPALSAPSVKDSIELLEEKAQKAKRDAQAKRKNIPPFVQKLNSFLDNPENHELIRWSDKGDSFIVLDEDEFSKKLIPELFKHNNYASFVRQLNMYGFHKRVGLSDNSMNAHEKKKKSISEYHNPYFIRGHPNLLWLINKPKSANGKKKSKKDGDEDSDDDNSGEDAVGPNHGASKGLLGRGESGPLQRRELQQVRDQLENIREQQIKVQQVLAQMKANTDSLYQQAAEFQTQHNRHENSINAILNFLANVFRKSLEEQGGAQSVSDLLASIIPNGTGGYMPQGSVRDISEVYSTPTATGGATITPMNPPKRPQQLLLGPAMGRTNAASTSPATTPTAFSAPTPHTGAQSSRVTELFDASPSDTTSPNYLRNELQSNPQEGMMKIINDTNARNTPNIDLPDVAANTPASMPAEQRTKMVTSMSRRSAAPASSAPQLATPFSMPPSTSLPDSVSMPATTQMPMSLSPLISQAKPPSLQDIAKKQSELDQLAQAQQNINRSINEITHTIAPLSPNGQIPGLDISGMPHDYFEGNNFDLNNFFDTSALDGGHQDFDSFNFADDNLGGADGGDFNFDIGGGHSDFSQGNGAAVDGIQSAAGRVNEVPSAHDTPSPTGTEEIQRADMDVAEPTAKRRRQG